jgi:hypothetical protein
MDCRPVSSPLELPMTAIPAGRPMAREFSSAQIASSQATTIIGCSYFPYQVGKPHRWANSAANYHNLIGRLTVGG